MLVPGELRRRLRPWRAAFATVRDQLVDGLGTDPRERAGRLASLLYAVALTAVVLTISTLPDDVDRGPAALTGLAAAVAGLVFALLPWRRLPAGASLVPPLLGYVLLGGGLGAGAGALLYYLPFVVLSGVYLGLTGRPGVPLLAAPLALGSGLLALLHPGRSPVVVPLVVTVAVGTVVGELIAATSRRDARLSATLDGLLTSLTGLSRCTTPESVARLTAGVTADLLRCDRAYVVEPDGAHGWRPLPGGRDGAGEPLPEPLPAREEVLAAAAFGSGDLVFEAGSVPGSSVAVPLVGPAGPVGVVVGSWTAPQLRLDDIGRRGVEVLAGEAGKLLARLAAERRLREQADTDQLSGLANRRVLEQALDRLCPGDAVVLLDLDHFKQLNDTAGHAVGDREIARFGQAMRLLVREHDTAARYGGEEFTLVLPQAGLDGATALVERLQRQWRAVARTTFSAGLAVHPAGRSPAATLSAADAALYRAKESGRDRWAAEHPGSATEPVLELDVPAAEPPGAPRRRTADLEPVTTGDRFGGQHRS